MSLGAHWGSRVGPDRLAAAIVANGATVTYIMAALNTGWCARFNANTARDVKSVRLYWTAITTPGTVTLRIETIDAATGKPSGTLYDANAVITGIIPAVGVQTYTFATLPTAGFIDGNEYALVILTTAAGTTQTLSSHNIISAPGRYPIIVLTAADGTTRSNFTEVSGAVPIASIVFEDDTEDPLGMSPYYAIAVNNTYGASIWTSLKITTAISHTIAGVYLDCPIKVGTPAGNLRVRVFDSSNNVISGTTVEHDKDSLLTGLSGRGGIFLFSAPVILAAGTYRIVFDSASSVDSSNCWRLNSSKFLSVGAVPSAYILSTSVNGGTSWTDSTTDVFPAAFILDNFVASGGGGARIIGSPILQGV